MKSVSSFSSSMLKIRHFVSANRSFTEHKSTAELKNLIYVREFFIQYGISELKNIRTLQRQKRNDAQLDDG